MRTLSLFASFLYLTVVTAGGYQGCLEKIWLFRAYEIDGLNPVGQRTLGFKCNSWNQGTNTCTNNNWEECAGRAGRCDFGELVHFLGRANNQYGWSVPATGDMNVVETAKACVTRFSNPNGRGTVYNAPPYKVMRNTHEYNDYIMKVSKVVEDTWTAGRHNDANKHMWDSFDNVREQIITARAGDHGPYLITAAQNNFGNRMTIETQDLGENPMTGAMWRTADWKRTAQLATLATAKQEIQSFLKDFYGNPRQRISRAHKQVMTSYKRTTDKSISCRSRAPR